MSGTCVAGCVWNCSHHVDCLPRALRVKSVQHCTDITWQLLCNIVAGVIVVGPVYVFLFVASSYAEHLLLS